MPACRSISTRRRTSSKGAKYRHRRNACLQEHFDEAAHEPQRGEVGACSVLPSFRSEARNPLARDGLQQTGGSLTRAFGLVRDDVRKYACWDDMRGSTPHPPSPPLCKGVSRALCASPRRGVRAWRTEVFAIVGKNRDRWRRSPCAAETTPPKAVMRGYVVLDLRHPERM